MYKWEAYQEWIVYKLEYCDVLVWKKYYDYSWWLNLLEDADV